MTERVGLLGWPVGHSVSPAMHNAAFAALGLDWEYTALPVPPDRLGGEVSRLVVDGYRGFNVTIPHKQAILNLPIIASITPAAREIGAVNVLVVLPDGTLAADNTDWLGFAHDLQAHGVQVSGQTCLVLGTGGSAQAIRYALHRSGAETVWAASRQPGSDARVIGYDRLGDVIPSCSLIVNCTPLGMSPHGERTPWPESMPFPRHAILYDLVYNPLVTRLMQQAQAAGARVIGGLGMLVQQGALAFERWTGLPAPRDVMVKAARDVLVGSSPHP